MQSALHVGNTVIMGGETLQLLPRALLANSPFTLGAIGFQGPSPESSRQGLDL